MDNVAEKWLKRAAYDLQSAKAMLSARRYLYVAFLCQQCIEKTLKAVAIQKGQEAQRTHNLTRLAESIGLPPEFSDDWRKFLAYLTPFAIEARYGDYTKHLSEIINRTDSLRYFKTTEEVFVWLKKYLKKLTKP
jgi:HEPN domain-containing protein